MHVGLKHYPVYMQKKLMFKKLLVINLKDYFNNLDYNL